MSTLAELAQTAGITVMPTALVDALLTGVLSTEKLPTLMKVDKVFTTLDEYHNSPEYDEVYKGYEDTGARYKAMLEKWNYVFVAGFTVKMDPKENYGRSFNMYRIGHFSDNMFILMKQEVHSGIDNMPTNTAVVTQAGDLLMMNIYRAKQEGSLGWYKSGGFIMAG